MSEEVNELLHKLIQEDLSGIRLTIDYLSTVQSGIIPAKPLTSIHVSNALKACVRIESIVGKLKKISEKGT